MAGGAFRRRSESSLHALKQMHADMRKRRMLSQLGNNSSRHLRKTFDECPISEKERKQRQKRRKKDYLDAQAERAARLSSIEQQWQHHRATGTSYDADDYQQQSTWCGWCCCAPW